MVTAQTTVYAAILISYLILGIIIGFFCFSIIRQQRRTRQLHLRNINAEITTLETERSRMSSDLHDELGPVLSVIKFQLDTLEMNDPSEDEILNNACKQIDEVIERLRSIARNLMPTSLSRKGLLPAIEEFVSMTNQADLIVLQYQCELTSTLEPHKSINVFRIVQELIQNTLRHSKATEALLQMKEEKGKLLMYYKDNGIGFDYLSVLEGSSGLGLQNIKSRIEIMGGELHLESQKLIGTSYFISIPI